MINIARKVQLNVHVALQSNPPGVLHGMALAAFWGTLPMYGEDSICVQVNYLTYGAATTAPESAKQTRRRREEKDLESMMFKVDGR